MNARLAEAMTSASLQIAYDPEAFTVAEVRDGGLMAMGSARSFVTHKVDPARGRILVHVSRAGLGGATGDGPLIELKLKPTGTAPKLPVEIVAVSPVGVGGRAISAQSGARYDFAAKPK